MGFSNIGYSALASFGTLNLTESSPPQSLTEVLTLHEIADYLRVDEATEEDAMRDLISAAREQAEIFQGRDLVRKQWDLSLDYWPMYGIELRAPLISVDQIQFRDSGNAVTTLTAGTDYFVDTAKQPGVVTPAYNTVWRSFAPSPSSAILVRFTSGYAADSVFWQDTGARVKNAMKLLISLWYNKRLPEGKGPDPDDNFGVLAGLSYGALKRVR